MSHAYPLAKTARDAFKADVSAARTRYEAEALAGDLDVKALETEWMTPSESELPAFLSQIEASAAHGFVQHYEDADGKTVLAVTYWKLTRPKVAKRKIVPKVKLAEDPYAAGGDDHTDDLYFRVGRNRKGRRKPAHNPNQMDLFEADAEKPDTVKD